MVRRLPKALALAMTGILAVTSLFAPFAALAGTTGDPRGRGAIEITLNPNRTDVGVTAVRESTSATPSTINLTYDSNSKTWKSGLIENTQFDSQGSSSCDKTVSFDVTVYDHSGSPTSSLTYGTVVGGPVTGLCTIGGTLATKTINVKTLSQASQTGTLTGSTTFYDTGAKKYVSLSGGTVTLSPSSGSPNPASINSGGYTISGIKPGTYTATVQGVYTDGAGISTPVKLTKSITINAGTNTLDFQSGTAPVTDPPPAASASSDPTCDIGSLTWVLCPLITVAQSGVQKMSSIVLDLLKYTPLTNNNATKTIWSTFRNLASVFFILLFFAVIFGVAIGLDNYTIKKIMPRLIAAAILIQFSYLLMGLMIDISNVVGGGISSLFAAIPVPSGGSHNAIEALGGLETLGLAGGAVALAITMEAAVPVMLALASALIGIIVVFVVLELRVFLLDVLIIIAPLAFLMWVLPNTEKFFKRWWDLFTRLLMMYPLIALLFATANVISNTVPQTSANLMTKITAAIAPIIAFYLVPATFKFGSSIITNGANFARGRLNKGHGMLRNSKGVKNAMEDRRERGLARLNDRTKAKDSRKSLGSRLAQAQAGHGFMGVKEGSSNDRRILGALEKNEQQRVQTAAYALREADNKTLYNTAVSASSDEYQRRAAIESLAKKNDTEKLGQILAQNYGGDTGNTEWRKATSSSFGDLKSRAPHLVMPSGMEAYDKLSPDQLSKLDKAGAEALVERHKTLTTNAASGKVEDVDALSAFETNLRQSVGGINNSVVAVNSIAPEARNAINKVGAHIGEEIMTPSQKAAQATQTATPATPTPTLQNQPTPTVKNQPLPIGPINTPVPTVQGTGTPLVVNQPTPFNPTQTVNPNPAVAAQRSGAGSMSWQQTGSGLVIPTGGPKSGRTRVTAPTPDPSAAPTPSASPSSGIATTSGKSTPAVRVTVNTSGRTSTSPTAVPGTPSPASARVSPSASPSSSSGPGSVYSGRIVIPSTASSAPAPTPEPPRNAEFNVTISDKRAGQSPTNIPTTGPSGIDTAATARFLPNGGRIILPGRRSNPPATSLRLQSRQEQNEAGVPGDDRTIS